MNRNDGLIIMNTHSKWLGYLFACAVTALVMFLRLFVVQDILTSHIPFVFFYISVTAAAWYGGIGPGLLAVFLSAFLVDYYFLYPVRTLFPITSLSAKDQIKLFSFLFEGIFISLLCEELHIVCRKLERKASILTQEIAEREKLAAALLKSEQEFHAIYDVAAIGIVQIDLSTGRFIRMNQKFCDILGYKEQELLGKSFLEITHPEDRERNSAELRRMYSGESKFYTTEKRYIHKDGNYIWVNLYVTALHDLSDHPSRTVSITLDISDRKKAEEILKKADRRKDEFIATLAHELRNPLAAISNSVHLMSLAHGDDRGNILIMMTQQVSHMVRLIDDLMDVARISQGKIRLNKENVLLADVVAAAVEMTSASFEEKEQELTVKVPPEPIRIYGDAVRLTQICTNLLTNASKYTDREGSISIEAHKEGKEASIVVRDNGVGIPQHVLEHIFDMFTQVNTDMGRPNGGLGIGLSITKNLIKLHGGNIEAYSEGAGKGSEFTVRLPLSVVDLHPQPPPIVEKLPVTHHHRVLIVDDNDASAKTIGWMMESYGNEYKIASNGRTAIELAKSFLPDIVLLDLGLPDMNGYEVCQKMRNDPLLKNAIIIAQTGWGGIQHRQHSKEAGFDYHLVKPLDMNALKQLFETEPARLA